MSAYPFLCVFLLSVGFVVSFIHVHVSPRNAVPPWLTWLRYLVNKSVVVVVVGRDFDTREFKKCAKPSPVRNHVRHSPSSPPWVFFFLSSFFLLFFWMSEMRILPSSPSLLALALLMSRVRAADDVEVPSVSLAAFPPHDLAVLAPLLDRAVYLHPPRLLLYQCRRRHPHPRLHRLRHRHRRPLRSRRSQGALGDASGGRGLLLSST